MKQFMAIYVGTPDAFKRSGWSELSDAERKKREAAGMKAWMDWAATNASSIVAMGGPLGKTKRTAAGGVTDISNNIAGYTVVQAESHEAAAKLFESHPHFAIFPGDAVEIMPVLPIPELPA
jgi:hypothetical protein